MLIAETAEKGFVMAVFKCEPAQAAAFPTLASSLDFVKASPGRQTHI